MSASSRRRHARARKRRARELRAAGGLPPHVVARRAAQAAEMLDPSARPRGGMLWEYASVTGIQSARFASSGPNLQNIPRVVVGVDFGFGVDQGSLGSCKASGVLAPLPDVVPPPAFGDPDDGKWYLDAEALARRKPKPKKR